MTFILSYTSKVESKIKKRCQKDLKLREKTAKTINQLALDPRHPGLETHKVISKLLKREALGSWINGEYRLVWLYKENDRILIIDFGTHNEVYL